MIPLQLTSKNAGSKIFFQARIRSDNAEGNCIFLRKKTRQNTRTQETSCKRNRKNLQNTQIDKNIYSEDDWLDFDESSYSEVDEDSETCAGDFDNTHTETSNLSATDSSFKAPGPDDLSKGRIDDPRRPRLANFPSTLFGNKRRCFCSSWYDIHSWLEYSVTRDAAFCFCFRMFAPAGRSMSETVFTVSGFRQWKKATGTGSGLSQHERSDIHKSSFCACKTLRAAIKQGKRLTWPRFQLVRNK